MWRPGKWVYVDDEPSTESESIDPIQPDSAASIDAPHSARSNPHDPPPSPPWKLGRVPLETATFRDGRRVSKRFERLKELKTNISPQTVSTRKDRRRSQPQQPISPLTIPNHPNEPTKPTSHRKSSSKPSSHHPSLTPPEIDPSSTNHSIHIDPIPPLTPDPPAPSLPHPSIPESDPLSAHPPPLRPDCSALISPTTIPQDSLFSDQPILTLEARLLDLKDQSKSNSNLEDLPQSTNDTNSTTEDNSAEPHTPPAIEFTNGVSLQRRSSAPPLADLPLPLPLKKYKPWEALKSFQTDGAEVAGDLRLIHEGHLHHRQLRLKADFVHLRHRASPPPNPVGLTIPLGPSDPSSPEKITAHPAQDHEPPTTTEEPTCLEPQPELQPHSSSSDLTELSSSLSDLSEQELLPDQSYLGLRRSSSSSVIYSESDREDDCLPEVLIRKVRRPSRRTSQILNPTTGSNHPAEMGESKKDLIKRKRRRAAVRRLRARQAALQPSDSSHPHQTGHRYPKSSTVDESWEPPPYIKIKSNVYPYRKPEPSEFPTAICNCTEGGCGERCINRAMFYLCDPKLCQLGQSCKNIPFNQRKDLIDESSAKLGKGLKVFYTGDSIKGWGLKTEIKLKKDSFIIDYRGEIISRDVCYKRVLNDYNGCKHFYLMDYDGSDVIDAGKKGNCSRFINHSCSPNLRVERFKLPGLEEYQFGLFTLRDIEIGEELSYDYGWRNFSDIAPTSNIRTSIRSKLKGRGGARGEEEEEDQLEEEESRREGSELTATETSSRPRRSRRALEVATATAPTVQRCYCGTKDCKGFLGPKKLGFSQPNAQRGQPSTPTTQPVSKSHPSEYGRSSEKGDDHHLHKRKKRS